MSIYEEYVLPHLIHLACGNTVADRQRQKIVPHAEGRVLEVGMGSGLNLRHYDPDRVELVWGLEPSAGMRRKARRNLAGAPVDVRWLDLPGEEIPLESGSVDTVVLTYTLCSIAEWLSALEQMRRVLKPGGRLLFCEHGAAPEERVRRRQDRLNPVWKRIAGGCNLNREIPGLLESGGFAIQGLETMYLPKTPKFAGYNYWGGATAR